LALPQENLCRAGVIGGAMRTRTKDPDGFIDGARRDRCAIVSEAVRDVIRMTAQPTSAEIRPTMKRGRTWLMGGLPTALGIA
jgi:hypothetical protein